MKISSALLTVCFAVATFAMSMPAHAARRVALLIGNSNYQHEKPLPNPVRDIALVEAALLKLGFSVEKLENQDKRGMELAINRFVTKTIGADTALVFYAGHGTQSSKGGRSYLLPVNAKVEDDETLETDGVLAEDIANKLEQIGSPAKLRLVILDACRSRKTTRGNDRGLAPPRPTDDYTLIAYSTKDGATADDGNGIHSPYAQALAKHLPRLAKEPVRLVLEDTADDVKTATKHGQKPQSYGNLSSRIGLDGVQVASIRPEQEPGPSAVQMEFQAWTVAQRANSVAAYNAYLTEYPNGGYAAAARVALAGLRQAAVVVVNEPPGQLSAPRPATFSAGQVFKDCQNAYCPEMVVIPEGSFQMGSTDTDGLFENEKPMHSVNVHSFLLGKYEVTKGEFSRFVSAEAYKTDAEKGLGCNAWMDSGFMQQQDKNWRTPGFVQGDKDPVVCVSWNDARAYAVWISEKTGMTYRLPSESEWEYAARAGSQGKWSYGNSEDQLGLYAWFRGNSSGRTQPVGKKKGSPFGLHDMHGNVYEWSDDCFHDDYKGAPNDGSSWTVKCSSEDRVLRGGSWMDFPYGTFVTIRVRFNPNAASNIFGFRLAKSAD